MVRIILLVVLAVSAFAQAPVVTNIGNFIHDVADLDRSVHFYRDVLGMDMPRPASNWQTNEPIAKMYNADNAQFRVAQAQITGSPMHVELVEFQRDERTPIRHTWGAPGNSILILTATDLAAVEKRLKSTNAIVLAEPQQNCDGRGLVVADPDGFAVMVLQRGTDFSPPPPGSTAFTALGFGYIVGGDELVKGPFAALGLTPVRRPHVCQPIEDVLAGSAQPTTVVVLPDTFELEFFTSQAGPSKSAKVVHPQDPGAGVLRLVVSDTDAAVQALVKAHLAVASAGGEIQTLSLGGPRAAILRAPDDLLLQVIK